MIRLKMLPLIATLLFPFPTLKDFPEVRGSGRALQCGEHMVIGVQGEADVMDYRLFFDVEKTRFIAMSREGVVWVGTLVDGKFQTVRTFPNADKADEAFPKGICEWFMMSAKGA